MSEIMQYQQTNDLSVQMDYARAVTSGGRAASILPDAYRDNPANALIAIGLGQAMGLTPAESLYRIAVIKGKPSASAELIAANVRKAGHKLRVKVQEDPPRASATIIRADDPDEPLTVDRDMAWATRMGLANEPNYKKQPATMLSYRAITACARLACPEALYGVSYTPDEAREILPDANEAAPKVSAADFAPSAPVKAVYEEPVHEPEPDEPQQPETDLITAPQMKKMQALFKEHLSGDRATCLKFASDTVGRPINTSKELTKVEAGKVIDALESDAAEPADVEPEPFDGKNPWATGGAA